MSDRMGGMDVMYGTHTGYLTYLLYPVHIGKHKYIKNIKT